MRYERANSLYLEGPNWRLSLEHDAFSADYTFLGMASWRNGIPGRRAAADLSTTSSFSC